MNRYIIFVVIFEIVNGKNAVELNSKVEVHYEIGKVVQKCFVGLQLLHIVAQLCVCQIVANDCKKKNPKF